MSYYMKADGDFLALLGEVTAKYHPELVEVGVTLDSLLVFTDSESGRPPLLLHGVPCAATIKLVGVKDRVLGKADLLLTVDGTAWDGWRPEEQVALLDHELTHVLVVRDQDGKVRLDKAGRPRLKLRRHDLEIGGFLEVCERHGKAALEAQQYLQMNRLFSQKMFPWG